MGRLAISAGIAAALAVTAVAVGAGSDLRLHRLHVPPPPAGGSQPPDTGSPADPSTPPATSPSPPGSPPPPGTPPPPPPAPPPPSGVGCTATAGGTPADATGTLVEYTLTLAPATTFAAAPTLRFRGVNMGTFAHAIAIKPAGIGALEICGTPNINPGQSDTFAVTNLPAGNYVIYCTIHSASMHQAISVN
jgi:plastocyanin